VADYRSRVRTRVQRGDTDAELLVLEPLLREFGAAKVAAAVSSLLRREQAPELVTPWPDVEAESLTRAVAGRAGEHRGARPAWSRVFIGAGRRDDVRPADLVGAITGEAGVAGAHVGKIEIRNGFSLVEIDSQVVDEVVRRLRGTTIRGRPVAVHLDREA
jgi:ATP-dependent RNA helicase DeaD